MCNHTVDKSPSTWRQIKKETLRKPTPPNLTHAKDYEYVYHGIKIRHTKQLVQYARIPQARIKAFSDFPLKQENKKCGEPDAISPHSCIQYALMQFANFYYYYTQSWLGLLCAREEQKQEKKVNEKTNFEETIKRL